MRIENGLEVEVEGRGLGWGREEEVEGRGEEEVGMEDGRGCDAGIR